MSIDMPVCLEHRPRKTQAVRDGESSSAIRRRVGKQLRYPSPGRELLSTEQADLRLGRDDCLVHHGTDSEMEML